jgi:Lipid A 3-O-deacylase (PagL)
MALFAATICAMAFCAAILFATPARAQEGIQTGDTELRVWAGGGHATNGVTRDDSVWNMGVRYGWVITKPFLPGPLRGRLEYAVDFMPAYAIYQSSGTAYGISFNPVNLKWIFDWHGRIVPYTELEGGVLFTNVNVPPPPGNSNVNFTTSNAIGAHFLTHKFDWSADIRFLHISNAGLQLPNQGVNTVQVRIGFGLFNHHKK